jgi:hypothetical protein
MNKPEPKANTYDIGGLIKWGAKKGLGAISDKVGFDLTPIAEPLVNAGMTHLALNPILEMDAPLTIAFLVIQAGLANQKRIETERLEARRTADASGNG